MPAPLPAASKGPLAAGPVAQWLEPAAHNGLVAGSSPAGPTNEIRYLSVLAFLRGPFRGPFQKFATHSGCFKATSDRHDLTLDRRSHCSSCSIRLGSAMRSSTRGLMPFSA